MSGASSAMIKRLDPVATHENTHMKILKSVIAAAVLFLPLTYAVAPANAATASNSQAGANGHNSNMEKPTMKKHTKKHMKKM